MSRLIRPAALLLLVLTVSLGPTARAENLGGVRLVYLGSTGLEAAIVPEDSVISRAVDLKDGGRTAALVEGALRLLVAGPDAVVAVHLAPAFPAGTVVDRVEIESGLFSLYLIFPSGVLNRGLDEHQAQDMMDSIAATLQGIQGAGGCMVFGRGPGDSRWLPIGDLVRGAEPAPHKPFEDQGDRDSPPAQGQPQPQGFLSGKSIFLSAGHGWYLHETYGWITQRGNTNGLVEDLSNAEAVNQALVQYLYNAGAGVYTTRERDLQTSEVIIDNHDPGCSLEGDWALSTSTPGYYGTDYATAPVAAVETARATFTPEVPADGYYCVTVWYTGGSGRSRDARYIVRHAGGETIVLQNQQRDGFTFRNLGVYYFRAGDPMVRRSVVISNQGADAGNVVVADAVRFGGGAGMESSRPRWEESGLCFAPFMGCASCATNTVSTMPRYAKWENEAWEDSIYVSWHTNAPNPGRGTSLYAYSSYGYDGPFDGVDGGLELRSAIHDELISDIRAGWDPAWQDRGEHTNWYGEINPNNNDEMPGIILELAFHDTPADAESLKEPRFRALAARAVYQAIVRYFADRDGLPPHFLPEPPRNLRAWVEDDDLLLAWDEPPADNGGLYGDPAEFYRIYLSDDGKGFADAIEINGTKAAMPLHEPAAPIFCRASAVNQGGESFPTETLAVFPGPDGQRVLLVNGFDRLDRFQDIEEEFYAGGTIDRVYLNRMNSFDYAIQHAGALAAADVGFDSASNDAAIQGLVDLGKYDVLVWLAGEESIADESLSDVEQVLLAGFLEGAGPGSWKGIFISGSEIGWDLWENGSGSDRAFYTGYLASEYLGDDAGTGSVVPADSGIFQGIEPFEFDYDLSAIYAADFPDAVAPIEPAGVGMTYNGTGLGAGIFADAGAFRLVYLAFPFETILSPEAQNDLMAAAMDFLLPPIPEDDDDSGDNDDDSGEDDDSDDDDDEGNNEDDDDDGVCCA